MHLKPLPVLPSGPSDRDVPLVRQLRRRWMTLIKTILWTVFWLAFLDVGINLLFPFPTDPEQSPNKFQQYFNYGRSIEGKLDQMIGQDTESSDPIIAAGWLDPAIWEPQPTTASDGDTLFVAVYGMSFSNDIGLALTELDEAISLRSIGGPSAPPSHTFAAYSADTAGRSADVVVMGILSSSVKRMRSVSGLSWSYEHPAPYTYPYYMLDERQNLVVVEPAIDSADEFIEAFRTRDESWQQLKQQMRQYDYPYSVAVFEHNLSDRSAIFRLIRRGWANRARNKSKYSLFDPDTGFDSTVPEIQTLKVLLREFVETATAANQKPIVLLIHDQGYDDGLYKLLSPHLRQLDAAFLSTHIIADANNPSNFISDGHFTPEVNQKLARALHPLIRPSSPRSSSEAVNTAANVSR